MQCHDVRQEQFFHCVCACTWFHRFPCSIVNMHDAIVFILHRFPRSIWRAKFFVQTLFIDLLWTGRFSFLHKNTFCVLRFPRSITDWIGFGLGWFGKFNTRCFSKRLLNELSNWLLFNCRTRLITVHVSCETWYREVNMFRISMNFIFWINKQEEHCLSSAQILTSRYQSIVDNRMKIECASDVVNVSEYSSSNHHIVL